MSIISLAYEMVHAVESLVQRARRFFHSVMLLGHVCPQCQGTLEMLRECRCRCVGCGHEFDPTVQFERCLECGGPAVLRVRRYVCTKCGADIRSKFLFDGLVFNVEYFRQKMAESRQRKQEQREEVRRMLAECRSDDWALEQADLDSVPGLLDVLNSLTCGLSNPLPPELRELFDLRAYENHVKAHIRDFPVNLVQIPPLNDDGRKDLVWRFIAVIFLAHAGILDVRQEGQQIMVSKRETDSQRQGFSGEVEAADGVQRSLGGTQAG